MGEPSQAEQLRLAPTSEVREVLAEVKRLAESGESEARVDLMQDDGSVLVVACRHAENARLEVLEPTEDD